MDDMASGIKRQMGLALMLTGWLHTVVGLIEYRNELQLMVSNGLWNTVVDGEISAAFWFMMSGFLLILLGYIADWLMKKKEISPPPAFGWTLLVVCLVGAIAMPVSGFWLVLPQAWILLRPL